jgi:hypothetical protein
METAGDQGVLLVATGTLATLGESDSVMALAICLLGAASNILYIYRLFSCSSEAPQSRCDTHYDLFLPGGCSLRPAISGVRQTMKVL